MIAVVLLLTESFTPKNQEWKDEPHHQPQQVRQQDCHVRFLIVVMLQSVVLWFRHFFNLLSMKVNKEKGWKEVRNLPGWKKENTFGELFNNHKDHELLMRGK